MEKNSATLSKDSSLKVNQRKIEFIKPEGELIFLNTDWRPLITVNFVKPRDKDPIPPMEINAEEFITVKGFKALGNQLSQQKIKNIELKEALPYDDERKIC
jgi:topoisomerase-4 subunit A